MASFVYNSVLTDAVNADLDFAVDSFKMMLVTSGYSASKSAHAKRSSVTNELAASGGYAAGGAATTCAISDDTNKKILTFSAVSWSSATFTTAAAVIYKARGGASSADELVCYLDFNGDVVSAGGTFSVSSSVITLAN
jgi:hypothetical protein